MKRNLFPPDGRFFYNVFTQYEYKQFLEIDASTDEGMKKVAKTYGLGREWRDYLLNSLTAIDGHDRQYFNKLRSTVVSRQIFIRSQSLIAR
jgi:hypothetical protein